MQTNQFISLRLIFYHFLSFQIANEALKDELCSIVLLLLQTSCYYNSDHDNYLVH